MGLESETPGMIDSRLIHDGPVVRLSVDTVRFPDGSRGELEMIRHSGAAAILPIISDHDVDPRVLLIKQYRYATGGYIYEVPAGRPDRPGEDWEECARRELEEETGMVADSLTFLTTIYTTPGFTDEKIHLFTGRGLRPGTAARDKDEFIELVELPFSDALRMVRDGEITDAKTICTLLYATSFVMGA
ncbi:MAG TPA: NUDIX hydrolase [Longimicrobiaceae bacterium]|nr:NUDIX hydrolase [Longimicrobiaceae bacterium]